MKAEPEAVDVPPIVPIVEDAASFEVVMLILPVVASIVACRLLAASAALSPFSVETWPLPVPKVIAVAVPPPVAAMVNVSPCSSGGLTLVVPPVPRPKDVSALVAPAAMTRFCVVPVEITSLPPTTVEALPPWHR